MTYLFFNYDCNTAAAMSTGTVASASAATPLLPLLLLLVVVVIMEVVVVVVVIVVVVVGLSSSMYNCDALVAEFWIAILSMSFECFNSFPKGAAPSQHITGVTKYFS